WDTQPGDSLQFRDGTVFPIEKRLGSGNRSTVFAIAGTDRVLRVPIAWDIIPVDWFDPVPYTYMTALNEYYEAGEFLDRAHIPHVRLHAHYVDEYVVTDRVPDYKDSGEIMTFSRLLKDRTIPIAEKHELALKLRKFIRLAAPLTTLADINGSQLAFDE